MTVARMETIAIVIRTSIRVNPWRFIFYSAQVGISGYRNRVIPDWSRIDQLIQELPKVLFGLFPGPRFLLPSFLFPRNLLVVPLGQGRFRTGPIFPFA